MGIHYKNNNLNHIFGSLTYSLEILYLLHDIKHLVRMTCHDHQVQQIKKFCEENKLFCTCEHRIIAIQDTNKGISNKGSYAPLNSPKGNLDLFISKDRLLCDSAARLGSGQSRRKGIILGYPECCVDFYLSNFERAIKKQMDLTLLVPSEGLVSNHLINICLRPFDISLISHFPCSLECKESVKLADKNLKLLRKLSPELAHFFETELKSFVIYSEYQGVHYAHNYHLDGKNIGFDYLHSNKDTNLRKELIQTKKISIKNRNNFTVGKKEYNSEDMGVFLFE